MRSNSISVLVIVMAVMHWKNIDRSIAQTPERPALVSSGASANVQALPPAPTAPTHPPSWPNANSVEQANWNASYPSNTLPQSHNQLPSAVPVQQISAQNAVIHSSSPSALQTDSSQARDHSAEQESGASRGLQLRPRSSAAAEQLGDKPKSSLLQMFLSIGSSFLLVVGLFLAVAWCYRRAGNSALSLLPKQAVSILGRTSMAPRQQLVLLRFGPKLVLVSLANGDARTISEITDALEVDRLAGVCESAKPGSITESFRSVLLQTGKERDL